MTSPLFAGLGQEAELGQSEDPTQLVHGDSGAISKAVGQLQKFQAAFAETHQGLSALDTEHWQGTAADLFRSKYAPHPPQWAHAADACEAAATSLDGYGQTVTWAQGQAKQAISLYASAQEATTGAQTAYGLTVAAYDTQVDAYNAKVAAGQDPGPVPTAPGPFQDPGAADRASAQAMLSEARSQRDAAGAEAATKVQAATQLAPKKPGFLQRAYDDAHDIVQDAPDEVTHLDGGIIEGAGGIVKFARSLDPEDPYNLTHPAAYLNTVSDTTAGLLHAGNHPSQLISALVGSGWSSDPAQAFGRLIPNLALDAATDGAGTAESASADIAGSAGEDSAAQAATEQAAQPGDFSHGPDATTTAGDPVDVASGRMTMSAVDVELPGVLPLVFSRTHNSGQRAGRWLGRSWACTADQRLHISEDGVVLMRADGVLLSYPHPSPGAPVLPECGSPWLLSRDTYGYTVLDPASGMQYAFAHITGNTALALLSEVTDRSGNRIAFGYDDQGAPTEIRHDAGYRILLTTGDGRITTLHLAGAAEDGTDAEIVRYSYTDGNLSGVVNSSGLPLRFDYDDQARITSWTDRNGSGYFYSYDARNRCVEQGGQDGHLNYRYRYDQRDGQTGQQLTLATDSLGHTSSYLINHLSQVVAETDPLGHTTVSRWDRHDRLLLRTDPLGRSTAYDYDDAGHLITVTRPDGLQIHAEYNALGLPTLITEADGSSWRQAYDDAGHRTQVTDPTGAVTRYDFDGHGHVTAIVDALGAVTEVRTDAAGLPVQVTDALGAIRSYQRDAFGRVVVFSDPLGARTSLLWTTEGRLALSTGPDGATESWRYDGEGNQIEHLDAVGQRIRCEYTHFDRLSARIDADGTRHEFRHDTELRLVEVVGPQGSSWRYRHDPAGRLIEETDFDGRVIRYTYDAAGQLIERTNAVGQVIRYTRDTMGHLSAKDADGTVTDYRHDPLGRLVRALSPDADLALTYDPLGRITAETVNGRTLSNEYDQVGRRTLRRTPNGTTSRWSYDAVGPTALASGDSHRLAFDRDRAGRETARHIGDRVVLAQSWDDNGRLATQSLMVGAPAGVAESQHRSYHYRADGHLLGVTDRLLGRRDFDLDPAGRVTAVRARDWSERYAYDESGNLASADWPSAPSSRTDRTDRTDRATPDAVGTRSYEGTLIRRAGSVRYQHDALGRVVVRQVPRLSRKADTWHYTWDADDRLTTVSTPGGERWHYRYDALGRRISKERRDARDAVVETVEFSWDGDNLAEQTVHDARLRGPVSLSWDYVGRTPLVQTERLSLAQAPQDVIDERFHAIITDLVGTPTELVDEDGDIAWRGRSTLWGTTVWPNSSTAYTPLRFPGQYYDAETRLNYNRHRYYDRDTARYLSPDPLGLRPSPNPQSYVVNPHAATDPLGLSPCEAAPPGRPDGQTVLSGHGGIALGDPSMTTIPEGTSLNMYSPHDTEINDSLGNEIETGNPVPLEVYGPGARVPNYILSRPDNLHIMGNPITVASDTRLSDLLKPGSGPVHWAACRKVVPPL